MYNWAKTIDKLICGMSLLDCLDVPNAINVTENDKLHLYVKARTELQ